MKKLSLAVLLLAGSFFMPETAFGATYAGESTINSSTGTIGGMENALNTAIWPAPFTEGDPTKIVYGTYPNTTTLLETLNNTSVSWTSYNGINLEAYAAGAGDYWLQIVNNDTGQIAVFCYNTPNGNDTWTVTTCEGITNPQSVFYAAGAYDQIFFASTTLNIDDAFNAGGLSTTTVLSFCDKNLPYDNSSIIQATITYIPNGLCRLVSFMVIPTTDSLNQFTTLASTTQSRFPFSYIPSISNTWNSLSASTTLNSPTYQYQLFNLGIGSGTPMGNILPNITVFSSSTVQTYIPSGVWTALKFLAGLAILLALFADIFFTVRNMFKKTP